MASAIHDSMPFLFLLLSIIIGLIGYVVRDAMHRLDALMLANTTHETKIAVLEDSKTHEKVNDHEARLRALESGLAEIKSDLKVIREILERKGRKTT